MDAGASCTSKSMHKRRGGIERHKCSCLHLTSPALLSLPMRSVHPYLLSVGSNQSVPHASQLIWGLQDFSQHEYITPQMLAQVALQQAWAEGGEEEEGVLRVQKHSRLRLTSALLGSPVRSAHWAISFISF